MSSFRFLGLAQYSTAVGKCSRKTLEQWSGGDRHYFAQSESLGTGGVNRGSKAADRGGHLDLF